MQDLLLTNKEIIERKAKERILANFRKWKWRKKVHFKKEAEKFIAEKSFTFENFLKNTDFIESLRLDEFHQFYILKEQKL